MPVKQLKTIAKKYGKPAKKAEEYWKSGKESAKKKGVKDPYAYAMAVTQRRMQKTGSKPHKKASESFEGRLDDKLTNIMEGITEPEELCKFVSQAYIDDAETFDNIVNALSGIAEVVEWGGGDETVLQIKCSPQNKQKAIAILKDLQRSGDKSVVGFNFDDGEITKIDQEWQRQYNLARDEAFKDQAENVVGESWGSIRSRGGPGGPGFSSGSGCKEAPEISSFVSCKKCRKQISGLEFDDNHGYCDECAAPGLGEDQIKEPTRIRRMGLKRSSINQTEK